MFPSSDPRAPGTTESVVACVLSVTLLPPQNHECLASLQGLSITGLQPLALMICRVGTIVPSMLCAGHHHHLSLVISLCFGLTASVSQVSRVTKTEGRASEQDGETQGCRDIMSVYQTGSETQAEAEKPRKRGQT